MNAYQNSVMCHPRTRASQTNITLFPLSKGPESSKEEKQVNQAQQSVLSATGQMYAFVSVAKEKRNSNLSE